MSTALCSLLLAPAALLQGEGESDLWAALSEGRAFANLFYRYEHAEDDAFAEESDASTLRSALGYETGIWRGFRGLVEFESISLVGTENYNSTVNEKTDHAVIADPKGTEVNQAYVDYVGFEDMEVRVGRQEIVFDNARFIGNVAWRQNHQSYDGLKLTAPDLGGFEATYAFLGQVNRIFGDESPAADERMASHLLHVGRDLGEAGDLTLYAYVLDFDQTTALSTATLGGRWKGGLEFDGFGLHGTLEAATQSDTGDNAVDIDQEYFLAELGGSVGGASLTFGHEHLGGSGDPGDKFTTPLATLHAFNGFADVFLATPDTGIEDRYVKVGGALGEAKGFITYHVFESDTGGIDYGTELDANLVYRVDDKIRVGLRMADFRADDAFEDVFRVMGWVSVTLL